MQSPRMGLFSLLSPLTDALHKLHSTLTTFRENNSNITKQTKTAMNDEDASSLTSEESHEPYFNTHTGAILPAREAWTILAQHDDRYRVKLENRRTSSPRAHDIIITPAPSDDDLSFSGPTQSSIDRALHPDYVCASSQKAPRGHDDDCYDTITTDVSDPEILRAQAMALAAANGQKLTAEQIVLIARPDVQQQKLIEETRKAKRTSQQQQQGSLGQIGQIGADFKKFIEIEKEKSVSAWGGDLGRFIEEQSMKLHGGGAAHVSNAVTEGNTTSSTTTEGKKKMEGFGSSPPPSSSSEPIQEEVRLSGILWKRRSGLGKHSTIKAWEKRRVELRGSKLLYYETPEEAQRETITTATLEQSSVEHPSPNITPKRVSLLEQAAQNAEKQIQTARDELSRMAQTVGLESLLSSSYQPDSNNAEPRGILDIVKENATIGASVGYHGAPTPFCISIKVKGETKWKFCFENHKLLVEWLTALNDVVVRFSVEEANREELMEQNVRWEMMRDYSVEMKGGDNTNQPDGSENIVRTFSRQLTYNESTSPSMDGSGVVLNELHIKIISVLSNFVIVLSRSSMLSIERWWTMVIFFNFGMYQLYKRSIASKSTQSSVQREKSISPFTPTKQKCNAVAGSSCRKVTNIQNQSNATSSTSAKLPTWLPITSNEIEVRSRGYLTSKKKIPSPGELYECIAVDCFQSDCRYSEMALRVKLPAVEFKNDGVKRWKSPDLFVVSIAIPTEAPSLGKSTEDGPGTTIVGYFKMKESTRAILQRITAEGYDASADDAESGVDEQKQVTNGVKLWEQYCKTAPTDSSFQARFKLIPQLNMDDLGCPSYISKYNGKPVLIKRNQVTGFFNDYPNLNAMEFDISLHPFPYLFKQAMAYLKDNYFDKAIAKFGFVIEGRSDDELPEVVIGAMQLCYPSPQYVMSDKDFFGK